VARHAKTVDGRSRSTRTVTLIVVWLGGLAAGFFGLLGAAARYGCGSSDHGLACRGSGSFVGVLLIVVVISVVTGVTVLTYDRAPRRVILVGIAGLVGLTVCFLLARALLATV
jgi:hypothetical protein